jgi:phosphoribosyl 1,2-cyclic phosphodiesterase
MKYKTKVCVLASTSAGNCTVIWNDSISFLVDCGTGVAYTEDALSRVGLSLQKLSAVFITHCHSDHVNRSTLKRVIELRIPVYCHGKVAKVIKKTHAFLQDKNCSLVAYPEEGKGSCEWFRYDSFSVPHDSNGGCFGYSFFLPHATGTHKISIATDIGFTVPGLTARFADSDIIIIESNHDVTLLAESSRPQWLKDRIVKCGHLSNDQCGVFIQEVLAASKNLPAAIVLAHISQECNTNTHAKDRMQETLAFANKSHIAVVETYSEKPSIVVSV